MSRIRKFSVSLEEFNQWLIGRGLKPLPDDYQSPGANFSPAQGDPDVFGSDAPAVTQKEVKPKAPTQPIWKWSWDPTGGLLIWPVDDKFGQPHHIEVTGPNFYKLAQGRVYVTADKEWEILVWEDRASEEWQMDAVDAVQEWLLANTGKEATDAFWQSEGGYYQTVQGDDAQEINLDKMIEAYFGVGMKGLPDWKKNKLRKNYQSLFDTVTPTNFDPVDENRKNDEEWLSDWSDHESLDRGWQDAVETDTTARCPQCQGEGYDFTGHICQTCHGSGLASQVGISS